ncbi:ABC transporter permease [Bradyrhizobium archetypum]|uniref:ABC transporter permease n=1 Tax=Bradyrhizobium archetypum TaxID=2721160 RepID=A0A7Y4H1M3_9BRAD|nr:ABC transporter permease [Bradyrhizobium archetypum]NOJ45970.1 ABC transporter permease [Bradyrhizobium archetypum]
MAVAAVGLLTPGFLTQISIFSILTAAAFTGCVAIGMTFITLGGNVVSFSLGVTLSATTIIFTASLPFGLFAAIFAALAFSAAVMAAQGWLVGYLGANPIIVSLAALSIITGAGTWITGGQGVYPTGSGGEILSGTIGYLPVPVMVCVGLMLVGQLIVTRTSFGRRLIMVGSNRKAAEIVGARPASTTVGAYLLSGVATGVAAILISARYRSGDFELGNGYDYAAISALLVGGNAIQGGAGSPLRAVVGALGIATIQSLLVLWGLSTQLQYLVVGVAVLLAIVLQAAGER